MKTMKICALAVALGFAGMMISTNANAALMPARSTAKTVQGQQPATPQQAQPSAQQPQGQEATAQVFAGKIMEQNGEYVLYDATSKTTYKLDDQAKAKQFKGQDVKVQGVLDSSSDTIKVAAIQPASPAQ